MAAESGAVCCTAYVASWHEAAVPAAPTNVRSWGWNGLKPDMPPRPSLTQLRHGPLKTFAAQKHCSFLR